MLKSQAPSMRNHDSKSKSSGVASAIAQIESSASTDNSQPPQLLRENFMRPPKLSQDGTLEPSEVPERDYDSFQNDLEAAYDSDAPTVTIQGEDSEGRLLSSPDEWENVPPDSILARLKLLKERDYGNNEKAFFKTYTNWSKLDGSQRDKCFSWFRKLTLPVRSKLLLLVIY